MQIWAQWIMTFATEHVQLVQRDILRVEAVSGRAFQEHTQEEPPSPGVGGEDFLENSQCIVTRRARGFNLNESSYC